jgi:hypothetical protein
VNNFDSDLHALLAGGLTAVLDFSNMADLLRRSIVVSPEADGAGNYKPDWLIVVHPRTGTPAPILRFHLRLTQEPSEEEEASA